MARTRLLISLALALGMCVVPASASAAFQSHVRPDHVSIVGTDEPETLHVNASGPLLTHSLTGPGFASEHDFDSSLPGTQTVPSGSIMLVVDAEGGDDVVTLGGAGARLFADGGDGGDTLFGGGARDRLLGGGGDDFTVGGGDIDAAFLGAGDDVYDWLGPSHGRDTVSGGDGTDRVGVVGTTGDNVFDAASDGELVRTALDGAGAVRFTAVEQLRVLGHAGDDSILGDDLPAGITLDASGGSGTDTAVGGAGDDLLAAETMTGRGGDDRMSIGPGGVPANADGGAGIDVTHVTAGHGADALTLRPAAPSVRIDGSAGGAPFAGMAFSETVVVSAGGGDDNLTVESGAGTYAAIVLAGEAGDDALRGTEATETLDGGPGDDLLDGGRGPDRLLGGPDDDVLRARDNARDALDCGDGDDLAFVDAGALDTTAGGACEQVQPGVAAVPVGLGRVFGAAELELRDDAVAVPIACSTGARGGCHGAVDLVSEPLPVGAGGAPVPVLLGVAPVSIAAGATADVSVPTALADSLGRLMTRMGRFPQVWAQVRTTTGEHATQLTLTMQG